MSEKQPDFPLRYSCDGGDDNAAAAEGRKNTFSTTYDFPLFPPFSLLLAAAALPPEAKKGDEENFPPSLFGKSSNFAPFLLLLLQSNLSP